MTTRLVGLQQDREKPEYQLRDFQAYDNEIVMTHASRPDRSGNGGYASAICADNGDDLVFGEWANESRGNR